jgi:general secretion pathway protein M
MKEWFASLQPRERLIVVAGSVAALIIALWMFVLSPLRSQSADLRDAVAGKQELLISLSRVEGSQAVSNNAGGGAQQTLVVVISSTAQQHGLILPRTREDGPDGINITLQNASFDALMNWLISLETTHSVTVESASISGSREQGLINGQLLLRRN